MFAEFRQLTDLTTVAAGSPPFSTGSYLANGLGMGVSTVAKCSSNFLRTVGEDSSAVTVCADGNATDNFDDPWANGTKPNGWGFYSASGAFNTPAGPTGALTDANGNF